MLAYDIINKTKRGTALTEEELRFFVSGVVDGSVTDAQAAAWLMAVCMNGLSPQETSALTMAMRDSGDVLDLSAIAGVKVDKHSTGGVGDKTSLILAPIVAACGGRMPKMSGRGLGHTGGTIDKLESIPGFSTDIGFDRFVETVNKAGFAIVAQSGHLVPADKKLYALRDHTATVDSIPLICSSIMSKKLATGADAILLDVKMGSGAFMKTEADAVRLGEAMVETARHVGRQCRAVVTDMDAPLGFCIGNAIEVEEAVQVLRGEVGGTLGQLCLDLAAHALSMSDFGTTEECRKTALSAVESGAALERFAQMIDLQGGDAAITEDPSRLPQPKYSHVVRAARSGSLSTLHSEEIGLAAMSLGAGRVNKGDSLDLSAGIRLHCERGTRLSEGDAIATLYSSSVTDFSAAEQRVKNAVLLTDSAPQVHSTVRCVVE
ncbi:MAG: thymidine phosphorylase [Ruminococcus sp.]|nr:thymidine phosphorylase [Ruminococcus sp.]